MSKLDGFLKAGAALAGEATNAAISSLVPGHEVLSSVFGGTAGSIVTDVINDMADRSLSKQESTRVSACAALVIESVQTRIYSGEHLRDDDFFRQKTGERPKAEQIFEGVLLKSKSQYEELKVKLLANLYSNACFDEELTSSIISFYMQALDRLTFEHLITLYEFVLTPNPSPWIDSDVAYFFGQNQEVGIHIIELRTLSMISEGAWGDSVLGATNTGKQFLNAIGFSLVYIDRKPHLVADYQARQKFKQGS